MSGSNYARISTKIGTLMINYPVFLEGQFVGYGYLTEELARFCTLIKGCNWWPPTPIGISRSGRVFVPFKCLEVVALVMSLNRRLLFSGRIEKLDGELYQRDNLLVNFSSRIHTTTNTFINDEAIAAIIHIGGIEIDAAGFEQAKSEINEKVAEMSAPSLCDRCSYFVPYPFSTCNAFHAKTGVRECPDFSPNHD